MVQTATNVDQFFPSWFGQFRTMLESVHANVLPTVNSILSNDLPTDDKSQHPSRAAQSSKRGIDFDFIELLLTLRQVKLTFAHGCLARLQKHKRHSRIPKRHKVHGGQRYPNDPISELIYPILSFKYKQPSLPRKSTLSCDMSTDNC